SLGGFEMKPADWAAWDQIGANGGVHDRDQCADVGTDRLWRQPAAAHLIDGLPDVHGRDRAQGERTERRDEVGAQSRSIPRQGGRTLARLAGQPVLGPLGEGSPSGPRIYERAAQDVGLGAGEPPLSIGLRGERIRRDDALTQAIVVANLPSPRRQATNRAELATSHSTASSVAPT